MSKFTAFLGLVTLVAAMPAAYADNVDDYVRAEMAKRHIPGLSLAVLRGGHVVKESAYGMASLELGVPVTLDTSYPLASMTKVFTSVAVMLLVQEGKLTLDTPVRQILPDLPVHWSHVTVRHCLTHTSGLPDAISDDINGTSVSGERDELFAKLAAAPLKPAGTKPAYNQTGYVIVGAVIEKLSGMDYEQFMHKRVFAPAHLDQASFGDAWSIIPGRSSLYTALDITKDHSKLMAKDGIPVLRKDSILHYGAKFIPEVLAPAGLMNASIRDLANWERSLANGSLLKPESYAQMTTPYILKDGSDNSYGLGFRVSHMGPYAAMAYGGGAATWRVSVPDKQLTVVVLTNLQGGRPDQLVAGIAALYEPELARK